MKYYISRSGQQYGPYSMEDLQAMKIDGRLDPNDLAWAEGMSSWTPLSQVMPAPQPQPQPQQPQYAPQQPYAPPPQQQFAPPAYAPPANAYGAVAPAYSPAYGVQAPASMLMPPNLHWGLVLLFSFLTLGIFGLVWMFIESSYVSKLDPRSNATVLYILGILIPLLGFVLIIIANFQMRDSIQRYYNTVEPIGLRLSGVMTFFFGILYFQYHFSRIAIWKQTGRLV